MKKKFILMLLLLPLLFSYVNADEYSEITSDVEIRYKWYREVKEGDYYPLKEEKIGYLIDYSDIKYGNYSSWSKDNCQLLNKYYLKDYRTIKAYRTVSKARFVKLENFNFNDNIKIYQNNQLIDYEVMYNENNLVKLDLKRSYRCETLTFFIENANNYKIGLYTNSSLTDFIISKEIVDEVLLIPDETWISPYTIFIMVYTDEIYNNSGLTIKSNEYNECRYREKYVYKYLINKEYYDDEYHLNVDGYIKDIDNYQVLYKGEPITNNVEIIKEKIVKQPQIEYVYIPNENNVENNDSSMEVHENNCIPEIKTKVEEKQIYLVPKKIYLVIILLIMIIIFLGIKLFKKCVD